MRESSFVARRSDRWRRCETLLGAIDRRGPRALRGPELREFGLTYRAVGADLSAARARDYSPELQAYLNRLVARGYVAVRTAERGGGARVVAFFTTVFPREFRRSFGTIAAVSALTIVAAIIAYAIVAHRPSDVYALLPAQIVPTIVKSLHDSNFAVDPANAPAMQSEIVTNNVKVAIIAFAGGITLGLLTCSIIVFNGLMVGALGAMFAAHGFGADYWATIAPHGCIELLAIQVAGAGGFLLARGVIAPGRMRRSDAVAAYTKRASVLVLGVAGMLVVAGTIEAFFTPLRTSIPERLAFGACTLVALIAYFGFAGRGAPDGAEAR